MKTKETATWSATKVQHLYRHKSGGYYARLTLNGKKTWRSLKTDVLSIAKPRLAKMLEEERVRHEAKGGKAAKGSMTVADAMQVRLTQIDNDPSIKARTRDYYRFLQKCLTTSWSGLEKKDVRQISEDACEEWAGKYAKTVSPTLFNNASAELRKILDIAVEEGIRSFNPAAKLKRRTPRKKDLSSRLPTKAQFGEWVAVIRSAGSRFSRHSADLVEFLAYSGLRISEVKWVEWRHCDFGGGELLVVGDPVERTKNGETRIVPMIPALRSLLRRLRDARTDEPLDASVMVVNEAQKAMDRAGKLVGMQHITHHDLRHFFATICIESGVDIPTVSRWLGHKDGGALAMRVYGHLRNEHSLESAKKVSFVV